MKHPSLTFLAGLFLFPLALLFSGCQAQPIPSRSLEAHEAEQSQAPPIQQAPIVPRSHGYYGGYGYGGHRY